MAKVKEALSEILSHDACYGYGWQFITNGDDYDVWACECNPYNIPADDLVDWKLN